MISFKDRLYIADHIKKNSWFSIGLATVNEIDKYKYFKRLNAFNGKSSKKLKKNQIYT